MYINNCSPIIRIKNHSGLVRDTKPDLSRKDNKVENSLTLPKYCYKPIFTSREMSEEEYQQKKNKIAGILDSRGESEYISGVMRSINRQNVVFARDLLDIKHIKPEKYRDILRSVNEGNENFARYMFTNENFASCNLDLPFIISSVNDENEEFAKDFVGKNYADLEDTYISYVLEYVNKTTLPLANVLCFNTQLNDLDEILRVSKFDSIKGFARLCADMYDLKENFPQHYIPYFPQHISKDDVKTLRDFYHHSQEHNELVSAIFRYTTSDNILFLKRYLSKYKCGSDINLDFLMKIYIKSSKNNLGLALKLLEDNSLSIHCKDMLMSLSFRDEKLAKVVEKLYDNKSFPSHQIAHIFLKENMGLGAAEYLSTIDVNKAYQKLEYQKKLVEKNPERYISGFWHNDVKDKVLKNYCGGIFDNKRDVTAVLSDIFDKETLDVLFRKRESNLRKYIDKINSFEYKDLLLLKDAINSCNTDGKPLMPAQKIELLDLIYTYTTSGLDVSKLKFMVANDKIDTAELNHNLMHKFLSIVGLRGSEIIDIPPEKLAIWDRNYISNLIQDYNNIYEIQNYNDVIKASLLYSFKYYISNTKNNHGIANQNTKILFDNYNLDYKKWLNPPKNSEVRLSVSDTNTERLNQIATQIVSDIEALRKTPAKNFIDKQLKPFIKNDKFVIPDKVVKSKQNMKKFTVGLVNQLNRVWKQADKSLQDDDKYLRALAVATIHSHLEQRVKDISEIDSQCTCKNIDLTIKMWDRIPQKDLFQGNYSTCCIGMGEVNSYSMPIYLLNTAFNMIELVDNYTGDTIGNALCYFVKDEDGNPAFMIDNIEIKNSMITSDATSIKIRDAIKDYAKNIAETVFGNEDIPIYMGTSYNDVPTDDLYLTERNIKFIGNISSDKVYSDVFNGVLYDEKECCTNIYRLV